MKYRQALSMCLDLFHTIEREPACVKSRKPTPDSFLVAEQPAKHRTKHAAGHRTTYLAPFRFINELHHGAKVVITMPYGRFTYFVQYQKIVAPTDVGVVDNVGYDRLVMSACNPIYSATQRIIVFARLRSVVPLGPARAAVD